MPQGIPNVGLSCWLASAAQCLLRVPQLVRILLTDALAGPPILAACGCDERGADVARGASNAISHGAVSREFADLARAYWRSTNGHIPSNLTRRLLDSVVTYRPGSFAYDEPCDAHEAVIAILEALHETFRESKDVVEYSEAPSEGLVRKDEWNAWNAASGLSMFTELFQAQILQKFGDEETVVHDWGLCVNPRQNETAQQVVVREFGGTGGEEVGGKKLTKTVVYAPPALVVSCATGGLYPFGSSVLGVAGFRYELMAAAFHSGNHWTSMGKTPETSDHIYAYFDDETSTGVTVLDPRINKIAKFLVYRRVD